ncbi:hypothetical protein Aperf_G00000017344 [Anoplocephala perfoliata]
MSFLIRITGPLETDKDRPVSPGLATLEEMKMEELIHQIFVEENITHDIWQTSRNGKYFVVEFPVLGRAFAEKILDRLSYYNVGKTEDSNIMIIDPAAVVCKRPKATGPHDIPLKHFQKFVNSLKSRLTVAQVYQAISSQGNFNFNYLCFLICAAVVADIALVTNSAACVFASMLLSPLMEPIMCIIFGLSLREKRMTIKGFRNTTVSLAICIIVGILFGIPAHFISMFQGVAPYPTKEMSGRGEAKALIGSVIVAAASGVSISFAILSNSLAAMIGNAISLSLLPPAVNCGQFFLLAVIASIDRPYVMVSFVLTCTLVTVVIGHKILPKQVMGCRTGDDDDDDDDGDGNDDGGDDDDVEEEEEEEGEREEEEEDLLRIFRSLQHLVHTQFYSTDVVWLVGHLKKIDTLKDNSNLTVTVAKCQYRWIREYIFVYISNACDAPTEFAILGVVSFCLTLLNIILIIITGYMVNRLKDLVPQSFTNDETRRFYTKDLKEVRDNYDCVHGMKASDLAAQAYQEYLRLNQHPAEGEYTPDQAERLTADFQAVMEGIGHDPHLQTITSWTHGGGRDFLAEFARATEFLTHGNNTLTAMGNGTNRLTVPRISIASDGTHRTRHLMPIPRRQTSCIERRSPCIICPEIPRGVFSSQNTLMGSTRRRYLRQLAAADDGDHADENHVKSEALSDQIHSVGETEPSIVSLSAPRRSYQPNQRHTRSGSIWKNLLNRREFSSVQPPSRWAEDASVNLDSVEKGNSKWKRKRSSQEIDDLPVGTTFGFEGDLSRVPSSESEESTHVHGINIRAANGAPDSELPKGPSKSQPQLSRISRSVFDVPSVLSRNQIPPAVHKWSTASVSTIGGKFEVTPTIPKPQSTKNLGLYPPKDL